MRKIYIFCDGGLGNRLGTLVGGLITSKILNVQPVISWPENNWCGCSFDDLFDKSFDFINHDINKLFNEKINDIFLIHENQTNLKLNKVYRHSIDSLRHIVNLKEDIVYYHHAIPGYYQEKHVIDTLKEIKINSELLDIVKTFSEHHNLNHEVTGIHFRKTDAPNNENENNHYKLISETSDKKYFICSDDANTEMLFKNLNNVVIYPKTQYVEKYKDGSWNDAIVDNEGRSFHYNVNRPKISVIEAFIDMLLLSRTTVTGESYSSFLRFAKHYSKIEI